MVELVEYAIVLLSSSLFAGASVATYSAFSAFGSTVQTHAEFSSLVDLATRATLSGNSTSLVALPDSTISCASGDLTLSSPSGTLSAPLGVACGFTVGVKEGIHRVTFLGDASRISIEVA